MRVLVAGVGNVLRRDDGFGVAVAERLAQVELPEGTAVVETGIGGVAVVQDLLAERFDALVLVDAVDHQRAPGTLMVIEPLVIDVYDLTGEQRQDVLADAHLATPERVLMLARALGVLPPVVRMVGCQPEDADGVGTGLSASVAAAVPRAADEVGRIILGLDPSPRRCSGAAQKLVAKGAGPDRRMIEVPLGAANQRVGREPW